MRADVRHDLKHDRFAERVTGTAAGIGSWASENTQAMILYGVIALVIIGAAIGGWFWYQRQNDLANDQMGHALQVYETPLRPPGTPPMPGVETYASAAERAQAARKEFSALASQHSMTNAGRLAQYFVGVTYREEGNNSEAEKVFKDVGDGRDREVANLAKYALASLYQATNRNGDAITVLKDLIEHPSSTVGKPATQLELASLYEQNKQPADAARLYEEVKKDNPKSQEAQYADSKLAALKASVPGGVGGASTGVPPAK